MTDDQEVVEVVDEVDSQVTDHPIPSKVSLSPSPMIIMLTNAEVGSFLHPVESEMLCSLVTPTRIPYFNAPIYLENKTQIGKVDEILGPINEVFFTVKMEQGMVASSFKKEDKVYIGGDKLLPIERFLPKPKGTTESKSLRSSMRS